MCKFFRRPTYIVNPACFILFCCSLFFFMPAFSQKKHSSKTKVAKSSNKRVIHGLASFYHDKFNNRRTSSGEIFSQRKLTGACNKLPLGTWVKVTNKRNGKWVVIKINDRLHPKMSIIADLTSAAAKKLGTKPSGLLKITIEVIGKKKSG